MKKGDKVFLVYKKHITGVIKDMRTVSASSIWGCNVPEYLVKYDDDNLYPPEDWHMREHLEYVLPTSETEGCDHMWVNYTGLRESYKYCEKCDEKQ